MDGQGNIGRRGERSEHCMPGVSESVGQAMGHCLGERWNTGGIRHKDL